MSTRDLDSPPQPTTELPPFIFVPDHGGTPAPFDPPVAAEAPAVGDPAPRRWGTGHKVAAAVLAVGVLVSGGAAWAAHDATGPATVGPAAGQLPGHLPGTLPGLAPDGTPDDDGAADT